MQSLISSRKTPKYKKLSRKRKTAQNLSILSCFMMECRWWDSNPHGFPNDFEFLSSSSIWCHPVISSDIWFPLHKGKIHASTNNNLEYPRFFDAFSLYSVFSIWTAQMEIGGMFRRDAGPVIQDCAHRLFSFFGKYFKPVQFRGRLIRIQNEATKPGAHPSSDTQ